MADFSMFYALAVVFVSIFLILYWIQEKKWRAASPPRPWGLPWFGHIHLQISEKFLYKTFSKLAEKFGPIYRLDFFGNSFVVISDAELLREAFMEEAFSDRPDFSSYDVAAEDGNVHGVLFTSGSTWKQLRQFTVKEINQYRMNSETEKNHLEVICSLVQQLKERDGESIGDWQAIFFHSAISPLWQFLTGKQFEGRDAEKHEVFCKLRKDLMDLAGKRGPLLLILPWLSKKFPGISGLNELRRIKSIISTYIRGLIATSKIEMSRTGLASNFCQFFLKKAEKETDKSSPFNGEEGVNHLVGFLAEAYMAAGENFTAVFPWLVLLLSRNPDVQRKCSEEIHKATHGGQRMATLENRASMPYTEAVIHEVFRFTSHNPYSDAHLAKRGLYLRDYFIPKGTYIIGNFHHIHHSKEIWGDPQFFRPERFLISDSQGNLKFQPSSNIFSFSTGKRLCPAYKVALDTIFLFSANLLRNFRFEYDSRGPDNGYEANFGIILSPKPFNTIIKYVNHGQNAREC